MRKNKFLAALAIAACLATSVPLSASAATPGQATDPTKVAYGTVTKTEEAVLADMYDDDFYKEQNPDLAAAGITTKEARFAHFIQRGVFEGRACNKDFNVSAYMAYEDLQKAFGTNVVAYYVHYNAFGKNEKRFTTVEGAVAAGKTVKSIDGKVVTAAAPKAAATSGSTTSNSNKSENVTNESDGNNTAPASSSQTVAATNNLGIKVTSNIPKNAEEAKLLANVEYDPATGKFYDFTKALMGTATDGLKFGYAKISGTVRKLENFDTAHDSVRYGTSKVGDDYSSTIGHLAKTNNYGYADSLVEIDDVQGAAWEKGMDPRRWYYDAEDHRYYERVDFDNEPWRFVSGGSVGDYNFKRDKLTNTVLNGVYKDWDGNDCFYVLADNSSVKLTAKWHARVTNAGAVYGLWNNTGATSLIDENQTLSRKFRENNSFASQEEAAHEMTNNNTRIYFDVDYSGVLEEEGNIMASSVGTAELMGHDSLANAAAACNLRPGVASRTYEGKTIYVDLTKFYEETSTFVKTARYLLNDVIAIDDGSGNYTFYKYVDKDSTLKEGWAVLKKYLRDCVDTDNAASTGDRTFAVYEENHDYGKYYYNTKAVATGYVDSAMQPHRPNVSKQFVVSMRGSYFKELDDKDYIFAPLEAGEELVQDSISKRFYVIK